MRSCKLLRTFLLSVLLVIQCISCMDLTHNVHSFFHSALAIIDQADVPDACVANSTVAPGALPMPEELDCPQESPFRRRVMLAAHSLPLRDARSPANTGLPIAVPKIVLTAQCPENARLSSWLYKHRIHDEAIKSEPLWLRFKTLLI